MNLLFWKRRRPQVRIKSVRRASLAEGGYLYELQPTSYTGPWAFEPGTVLEIVDQPKQGKSQ